MKRYQAFKYELKPNGEQQRLMRRFVGSCRFVFNKALAIQSERYERSEKKLGFVGLCKLLTEWRNSADTPWLKDMPVHPQQQKLMDLERAYVNFFAKRAKFPRFKRKGEQDSFRYPDPKQIKLDQVISRIRLPKLGWLRYRNSRPVIGTIRHVTVSANGNKWFVSIQTVREIETTTHPSSSIVGVDLGISRFATLSDETVYLPISSYSKHKKRLAFLQRRMSRKQRFSANWKKTKSHVQKLHTKIANSRHDFLHKITTDISKNHAIVIVEDLQIRNMSKSAAGTLAEPGRNVKAKSSLNASILDQGWFEFRRQLEYKQAWRGGWVFAVPPQHTSQRCSACGHTSSINRRTQARFKCVTCNLEDNADLNAARNIEAAGHAVLAHGESVQLGRSRKWEPAEASQAHAV